MNFYERIFTKNDAMILGGVGLIFEGRNSPLISSPIKRIILSPNLSDVFGR